MRQDKKEEPHFVVLLDNEAYRKSTGRSVVASPVAGRSKWDDFEGAPMSGDKALEKAVMDISSIAMAGGTTVYNAPAVRKVLLDLLRAFGQDAEAIR